jgi:hypothetical protein
VFGHRALTNCKSKGGLARENRHKKIIFIDCRLPLDVSYSGSNLCNVPEKDTYAIAGQPKDKEELLAACTLYFYLSSIFCGHHLDMNPPASRVNAMKTTKTPHIFLTGAASNNGHSFPGGRKFAD